MLFDIKEKVFVVTGGSSGIGKALIVGLLKEGAKVYSISRRIEPNALHHQISADLSIDDQLDRAYEEIARLEPNGIDCLINNAGINWIESFESYSLDAFRKVLNLNVVQVFHASQKFSFLLEKKATVGNPSRIINIGSIHGIEVPRFETFAYTSSKAAVHHLTKHLARKLANRNILVNAIAPGIFASDMTRGLLEAGEERITLNLLVKRIGSADDILGAVQFLSSSASSFITGVVIPLDGGAIINSKL